MATSTSPSHPTFSRRHSSLLLRKRPQTAAMDPFPQTNFGEWHGFTREQNENNNIRNYAECAGPSQLLSNYRDQDSQGDPIPFHRSSKSFSGLLHGLSEVRSLARRMSHSIRPKHHKLTKMEEGHAADDSGFEQREITEHNFDTFHVHELGIRRSHSTWFRSARTPHRARRPSLDVFPQEATENHPRGSLQYPRPTVTVSLEPPSFSEVLSGGAAARAAAAAQNEFMRNEQYKIESETWDNNALRDSESGIGIDLRDKSEGKEEELPVVRRDPVNILPPELMSQILSELDSLSLVRAELVSRDWYKVASCRYVWRHVFHRESGPLGGILPKNPKLPRVGGMGMGRVIPNQDWKRMFQVRKALDDRWKYREAAAIYLHGHADSVYCVQFDEEKIITGSRDQTIRVWDIHTYQCTKIIGRPRQATNALSSPSYQSSHGGSGPIAQVPTPHNSALQGQYPEEYHRASILCLQFDKEIMVTGSSDCTCIIWDIKQDYKPIHRLRGHTAGVLDVCFDEKIIISCSKDTTLRVWDRYTGELITQLLGHRGPVNAVQLRGELAVSASGDGVAKLWNLTSSRCIKEFPSRDRGLACVEFSEDGKTILAGGNDQVIYQFDAITGSLVKELKGHRGLVRSLHLDSVNRRVVSGSYDMSVKVFDLDSGELIIDFPGWTTSWMLSAKADYRRIVATSQDSRTVIMDFGYGIPGVEMLEGC
ncbi:MAG: hypothetical protein M1834_000872 [Cirrosporium novae-zelandiae]|nr:MAG: hypothetical protein M1834_000872 [Cirrosporium novae-zelandiae]